MNYESAELAKISINLLLSSSINVSNILAMLGEDALLVLISVLIILTYIRKDD